MPKLGQASIRTLRARLFFFRYRAVTGTFPFRSASLAFDSKRRSRYLLMKTIQDYQRALARMGVSLPSGKKTIDEYKKLLADAEKAVEAAENVTNNAINTGTTGAPARRAVSPAARTRPTKNIPLSQQTPPAPKNIPLSQQMPTTTPVMEPSPETAPSFDDDTSPEEAPAGVTIHASRPRKTIAAFVVLMVSALCLGGAAFFSPASTAPVMLAAESAVPHEQPEAVCVDVTEEVAVDVAETAPETTANPVPLANVVAQPVAEPVVEPVAEPAASAVAVTETEQAETSSAEQAFPMDASAAETATVKDPIVVVDDSLVSVATSTRAQAPPPPPAPVPDRTRPPPPTPAVPDTPTGSSTFAYILAAVGALASSALHGAGQLSVQLSVALSNSESLRWMASTAVDWWWMAAQLIIKTVVEALVLLAALTADVLAHAVPWIVANGPAAAKALVTYCVTYPHLAGACIAAVGALHFFGRAGFWYARYRDGKHASRATQVDAAARWVLGELRAHTQRWESVSGQHNVMPLPPIDLKGRVPHSILADRKLWREVEASVQSHSCVRVTSEGWLFCDPLVRP